ncbi:MAG: hypothetical protein HC902_00805 [Calothrix sp. SM1_5_4]|nr:hypothetical protein [Calothrix sp. SM1_5_4]
MPHTNDHQFTVLLGPIVTGAHGDAVDLNGRGAEIVTPSGKKFLLIRDLPADNKTESAIRAMIYRLQDRFLEREEAAGPS